ncbi:MAG: tetratricopeptide repeat protein [Promethearchaeota archaeon]
MSVEPDANALFNIGREQYLNRAFQDALKSWKAALNQYQKEGKKRESGIVTTEIGKALLALGQKMEALVSCTQAVRILREVNDPPALRSALTTMALIMEELDYFDEANRAYIQALQIPPSDEDISSQITLLNKAANSLARVGNYRESAVHYKQAVQLLEKIDDLDLRGDTLTNYARILQQLDEHNEAEEILTKLIRLWDSAGKPHLSAYTYLGLASTYLAQGYIDKAYATIQQAQSVFTTSSDKTGLALCEYHRARLILQRGEPEEALPHGETALKYFETQKNYLAYAESALVVAQILGRLVQDVRAFRLFDRAITIFAKLKEKARELQTHVLKGKALLRIGKRKEAEQEFTQVIRYYHEHSRPEQEANIYIQVGELFLELAQFQEAIEQSKLALNLLSNLSEERLEIRGYRLLLNSIKKLAKIDEERAFLQTGLQRAREQEKLLLVSTLTVSLAHLSLDSQPTEQIQTVLEKAIHDEQLPTELRTEAAINLGIVLMKTNQFSEAAQYLSQAIKDFGDEPTFDKNEAYLQLAEAYKQLAKPNLQKEALIGALEAMQLPRNPIIEAKLLYELAPLLEKEDTAKALEYYEKAAEIFSEGEFPEEYFRTLLKQASLRAESADFNSSSQTIKQAIRLGLELDIPTDFTADQLPLPWTHINEVLTEAITLGAHIYHKHGERAVIDQIIDWSTPRKVARLQPFLTNNLGFERCSELMKLLKEETALLQKASEIRRQLSQLTSKVMPEQEYQARHEALRTEFREIIDTVEVNRNVIAAACPDPGRGMIPQDYKMLQKLSALMPPDRRWILINYDVLLEKQRIIVSTLDHVGRHNLHTLPISSELPSVIQSLQGIKTQRHLPSMTDLKDIASLLYRSLIPSLLERELENHKYGFLQFITDGFLNNVPFELIFDGKEYWGLKYPMAWVPDFQFFESTLKTKALSQRGALSVVLGVNANPEDNPSRKETAEEITKMFLAAVPHRQGVSEPIVLFGRDFTRNLLTANTDQPRSLLYLSTPTTIHHQKGELPLSQPDSLRVIEVGVTTYFKGAPILILDDCTRPEPMEDGSEQAGFLRHFVTAGIPSIIFSRWRPSEKVQPAFAQTIVRQLFEGDPVAVALMQTRRKLAARGPSPQSWLHYSLCGNPFPSLL